MANEHKIDINKRELSGKQGIKQIRRDLRTKKQKETFLD